MFQKKHKIFFRFLNLVALLALFSFHILPAMAGLFGGGVSIPSASDWASQIERRYNLDTAALQDQGQSLNVATDKTTNPQVSLYFSPSDPKVGEKVTALALPIYFFNNEQQLYYTWYVKHKGCDLKRGNLSTDEKARCDLNNDNNITVEDWKIEAMRILASNDFDYATANYSSDTDNDGYSARFGGDASVNVPNHCYYHDNSSGTNYEIAQSDNITFGCTGGRKPVCMTGNGEINPATFNASASGGSGGGTPTGGSSSVSGDTFDVAGTTDTVSGLPVCSSSGTVSCNVGTPCCVSNPATATSCEQTLTTCDGADTNANPYCRHLFPNAPGATTGNGSYGAGEEQFWRTNSNDPDTAENGNKDEANVVGLGQSRFSWNYDQGDLVGVVVEGTSTIPTKYNDSSNMIMWAFSKNNCPVSLADNVGSYNVTIRNYTVTIPTVDFDFNKCLEKNLVDPAQGGQATNLEVSVSANPDNPQNDSTGKQDGDMIQAVATIDNAAKSLTDTFFDWKVELSPDGTSSPTQPWVNVTGVLNNFSDGRKLLSTTRGNGLNSVRLKLNLKNNDQLGGHSFSSYLRNDVGYLRFRVDAAENFNSSGANRKGKSSVIVKFLSSTDRIQAYTVDAAGNPAKVSLVANEICSGTSGSLSLAAQALAKLEAKVCRVLSNEIIGLSINNSGNQFSNFNWTINGKPLVCNSRVSNSCFDDHQGNINFFPVVGNVGDMFTLTLTANKVDTSASATTEKTVTLSRIFKIVDPAVEIISADDTIAWPKVLGRYKDANGNTFIDTSKNTLQALSNSNVTLQANFIPSFLSLSFPPKVERSWVVDTTPLGDGSSNQVSFTANKPAGSIYNIQLAVVYRTGDALRKALQDIWGISVLDSGEQYFGTTSQLEHPPESNELTRLSGPKKYFALLSNYLPASILFSFRVLLSIGLILFVSGLVFAVLPAPAEERSSPRR